MQSHTRVTLQVKLCLCRLTYKTVIRLPTALRIGINPPTHTCEQHSCMHPSWPTVQVQQCTLATAPGNHLADTTTARKPFGGHCNHQLLKVASRLPNSTGCRGRQAVWSTLAGFAPRGAHKCNLGSSCQPTISGVGPQGPRGGCDDSPRKEAIVSWIPLSK